MTNNKISNLIKVVAVFVILCGASARPQAANGGDTGDIAIGFTFGTQLFSGIRKSCEDLLEPRHIVKAVCDRAALAGGPHLRIGLAPHHSIIFSYRISGDYEDTKTNTEGAEFTERYSSSTGSLAYQIRVPLGEFDTEGFIKAGYHSTDFDVKDTSGDEFTVDRDGVLFGVGVVYNEHLLLGYEYFDAGDRIEGGHVLYLGAEFSL